MGALVEFWPDILRGIERSQFGDLVRNIPNLYPVLESLHVLGIALLVGPAMAVDLRLLGAGKSVPVTLALRHLLPVSHIGFGLAALTGITMFCGVALSVGTSLAALLKLSLLLIALVNVLVFHNIVVRNVRKWDINTITPLSAKTSAFLSMLVWTGVIIAGRFLVTCPGIFGPAET